MTDILHLFVLATIGAIIALLLAEFAKNNPNKPGGVFDRVNHTISWALNNSYGNDL